MKRKNLRKINQRRQKERLLKKKRKLIKLKNAKKKIKNLNQKLLVFLDFDDFNQISY